VVHDDSMADLADLGVNGRDPANFVAERGDSTLPTSGRRNTTSCGGWPHSPAPAEGRAVHRHAFGDGDPWASMRPQFAAPLEQA